MSEEKFYWNDGGRAAAGFVGLAGDCVTRAIAIATGRPYREVYDQIGRQTEKSPRNGVDFKVAARMLEEMGWRRIRSDHDDLRELLLAHPAIASGVTILHLGDRDDRLSSHLCVLMDGVLHDTWDCLRCDNDQILHHWVHPTLKSADVWSPAVNETTKSHGACSEFERILGRLRALENTANNHASTDGEKRNAIRMMQAVMLRHNLTREDIRDDDNADSMVMTLRVCAVNRNRASRWEKLLSSYLCEHVFPLVQTFISRHGHRTMMSFYGPRDDVRQAIELFRELLVSIAASAQLRYGGHVRGSGASYAEGYVMGLPRPSDHENDPQPDDLLSQRSLIHARTLAVQQTARDWLSLECNIRLVSSGRSGRSQHDPAAANAGHQDGKRQRVSRPSGVPRLSGPTARLS